jgi:hypothetical protein
LSTLDAVDGRPGCDLCRDLDVVRYDLRAEHRPAPFCSRCGRELDAIVVLVEAPMEFGRPAD